MAAAAIHVDMRRFAAIVQAKKVYEAGRRATKVVDHCADPSLGVVASDGADRDRAAERVEQGVKATSELHASARQ
jgi:hypothetical protein